MYHSIKTGKYKNCGIDSFEKIYELCVYRQIFLYFLSKAYHSTPDKPS